MTFLQVKYALVFNFFSEQFTEFTFLKFSPIYFSFSALLHDNNIIEKIEYEHPQFDIKAINMQKRREEINGVNNSYFAGAYWRYGFHEDGIKLLKNFLKY